MRRTAAPPLAVALLLLGAVAPSACVDVPVDGTRSDRRLLPARGALRGTFRYEGRPPCTEGGHVVGGALIALFAKDDPPPPRGTATMPKNFVYLPGDVLFPTLPRSATGRVCPPETELVTASAPYAIAPVEGGAYEVHAFYSRSGTELPSFAIRNQAEAGDLRGGYIDSADALAHRGDPSFAPRFLPVEIGLRAAGPADVPDARPTYTVPAEGYLADDVSVTVVFPVPFPRPYFRPTGAETATAPALRVTQDFTVLAAPAKNTSATWAALEASYPKLPVTAYFPAAEADVALAEPFRARPFPPAAGGGLQLTATGGDEPLIPGLPLLGPRLALLRLDGAGRTVAGYPTTATTPRVELGGFPLDGPMETTAQKKPETTQGVAAARSALTYLLRPVAYCGDPSGPSATGVLVTPRATGPSAAPADGERPIVDEAKLLAAYGGRARALKVGCLPLGRYAIQLAYGNGQAWTTPNEAGLCADEEGAITGGDPARCAAAGRPVLRSQGATAVVEIVPPTTDEGRDWCARFPTPSECGP